MEKFCFNCFNPIEPNQDICILCGFDPKENRRKYPLALPCGTVLAGNYIVGKVLGQGGFGITYLAYDYQTHQKVAVKEYFPDAFVSRTQGTKVSVHTAQKQDYFEYGKECFIKEARALSTFSEQPNIPKVYRCFEENGTVYFVMDYIEGVDLKTYLKYHNGKCTWEKTYALLLPIAEALETVHQCGMVHRDVKPDNIIITGEEKPYLVDFGSARFSTGEKSQSLSVILTAGYAPLEQYTKNGRQGPFTDVYALAATMYRTLTGKKPPEAVDRTMVDEMVPPEALGVSLPKGIWSVLQKALAVSAEHRIRTMSDFIQALKDTDRNPIDPKPVQPVQQKEKVYQEALKSIAVPKPKTKVYREALSAFRSLDTYKDSAAQAQICALAIQKKKRALIALIIAGIFLIAGGIIGYLYYYNRDLTWSVDDGILTIYRNGDMENYSYASPAPWNEHRKEIKKIVIKGKLTNIGAYAFYNLDQLTKLEIPDSVTSIGENAIASCDNLKTITIPDSVTEINQFAFSFDESLTSVTLSNALTTLDLGLFDGCESLEEITIPNAVTTIGSFAFSDCTVLKSVSFGNGVTKIENNAFEQCTGLTEIVIPKPVTVIGSEAFKGCTKLTDIEFKGSQPEIGSAWLADNPQDITFHYPATDTTWNNVDFQTLRNQ